MNCPHCQIQMIAVEYRGTSEDYDGISEFTCPTCGRRYGRWTGRELKPDELEPRYGRLPTEPS